MKKILFTLCLAIAATSTTFAQNDVQDAAAQAALEYSNAPEETAEPVKPNYWTNSLALDFGLTNTFFQVWAAGGSNNITIKASMDAKANYKKNLVSWTNRLQLLYGFISAEENKFILKTNNDRIYLESKLALKTVKDSKWSYSAAFDFKSQFANAYSTYAILDDKWDPKYLKSSFMSPAYTNIALGIDWVPTKWLTVNMAPLTGGFTICTVPELRQSYGMELISENVYKNARFQFGAQIKTDVRFVFNEKVSFESQLVLFSDYLNHPLNLRVNWDNKLTVKLGRFFNIALNTWMIYDPIVLIKDTDEAMLEQHPNGRQRVQFKEYLSFNFAYTFKNK